MSDESPSPEANEAAPERAGNPFDRPYFLPALIFALALWFGYDGWFNEEIESILFNRVVFGILVVAMIYTTWQDIRYTRKSKD